MNYHFFVIFFLYLPWSITSAQILLTHTINDHTLCSTENSLIVIAGHEIEKLSGTEINKLSLISIRQNQVQAIMFQIDQKDNKGRYILGNTAAEHIRSVKRIDDQDELVFRKKDLGEQLNADAQLLAQYSLIEIKVTSAPTQEAGWIYIILGVSPSDAEKKNKAIVYNIQQDRVSTSVYKIGFTKDKPFLVNTFHWNLSRKMPQIAFDESIWGPNMTDTMKIRHLGRFLGFSFKRTDDDYYSQLVAVKEGPLRIIRRTENKIKVLWKLKSPALYIDYVMMPDGFVMDSMVDIPFKISFFFSELATITTMDWNYAAVQDDLQIQYNKTGLLLKVNGLQTEAKEAFNDISATTFSTNSQTGQFAVRLDIPDDFPIKSQLYLKDSLMEVDEPENYPGQYGNVGFKTTGWENIGSQLYHLKFTVCVARN